MDYIDMYARNSTVECSYTTSLEMPSFLAVSILIFSFSTFHCSIVCFTAFQSLWKLTVNRATFILARRANDQSSSSTIADCAIRTMLVKIQPRVEYWLSRQESNVQRIAHKLILSILYLSTFSKTLSNPLLISFFAKMSSSNSVKWTRRSSNRGMG